MKKHKLPTSGKSRSKQVTKNAGGGVVNKIPPGFFHDKKTPKGKK